MWGEVPISADDFETLFSFLDTDASNSLSLEEFTTGASFRDQYGRGCDYYKTSGLDPGGCPEDPDSFKSREGGVDASVACCACGGGLKFREGQCYHGCTQVQGNNADLNVSNSGCQPEKSGYTQLGSIDCCGCAPKDYDFRANFTADRVVHENTCMKNPAYIHQITRKEQEPCVNQCVDAKDLPEEKLTEESYIYKGKIVTDGVLVFRERVRWCWKQNECFARPWNEGCLDGEKELRESYEFGCNIEDEVIGHLVRTKISDECAVVGISGTSSREGIVTTPCFGFGYEYGWFTFRLLGMCATLAWYVWIPVIRKIWASFEGKIKYFLIWLSIVIPGFPLSVFVWGGEGCGPFRAAYQTDYVVRLIAFVASIRSFQPEDNSWMYLGAGFVYFIYEMVADIAALAGGAQMTCGFGTGLVLLLILSIFLDLIWFYLVYKKKKDSGSIENTDARPVAIAVLGHGGQPIARF